MADYTVAVAKHATLAAGVADSVTLGRDFDSIEVLNRGGTELYFAANQDSIAVAADNAFVVMPGGAVAMQPTGANKTVVRIISLAAIAYSVTGI